MRMRLVVMVVVLMTVTAAASAQIQMPDPKQIAGVPLPATDLPAGTISVRVIRGNFDKNITGATEQLTLANADGTNAKVLQELARDYGQAGLSAPQWSPNGRYLLYTRGVTDTLPVTGRSVSQITLTRALPLTSASGPRYGPRTMRTPLAAARSTRADGAVGTTMLRPE